MTSNLDKIRSRIRHLRNMTTANGCTEAEAMRAAEIALRLMERYGLAGEDLENETAGVPTPGRRRQVIDDLWSAVAFVCGCQGWIDYTGDRLRYVYFGRPSDVIVAEYLHELLAAAYRHECEAFKKRPEYLKRRLRRTRSAAMKAFQQGMVGSLRAKLANLWWRRAKDDSAAARDALIAAHEKHLEHLNADLDRRGYRFSTVSKLKLADRRFDDARCRGHTAGHGVAIDPGVAGSGGVVGQIEGY